MNPITATYTIVNLSSVVEILSITLSVIALTITIIGFFASLKFYRDGVQLQDNANKALVVLGEKTQHIQSQVGDMFSKTLDAAIGQRNQISENFDHINKQLEKSAKEIVDNAIKQVGVAGDKEKERLSEIVNKHMEPLRKKINATRESAQEIAMKFNISDFENNVLNTILSSKGNILKESELCQIFPMTENELAKNIRRLLHYGFISPAFNKKGELQYSVTNEGFEYNREHEKLCRTQYISFK